jgi:multisubunit Na+/H+ antiporter MnhC subunit
MTRRKIPLLAAILIFGLAMWIFVYADLARIVLSLILLGAGQVMMNAFFGALQTDLTPKEQR